MKKILFVTMIALLLLSSVSFAQENPAPAPTKQGVLQSVNLNDIKEFDKKDILKKVPLDTEKLVFNIYFLEPRQILNFHKHPATDELFYIVEGRGQFTLGNNQIMVDSGSVVYGPENVFHGVVNSSNKRMVMLSVQAPKPVKMVYAENANIDCPVCGQENIIPDGAKEGDVIVCPRCHAKLKLSKSSDGKWIATQL